MRWLPRALASFRYPVLYDSIYDETAPPERAVEKKGQAKQKHLLLDSGKK